MYKVSNELASINKYMKVKFNLIINDDEVSVKSGNYSKVLDTFQYNGSEYLKISPKPYITIDISKSASDKNEKNKTIWNSNSQVNLNKLSLFDLLEKLKLTIDEFKTVEDMFFIKNDKIYVDKDRANKHVKIIRTTNKTIFIRHSVVIDADDGHDYEGITFYINESANFCTLTYKELTYLYYELSKINMHEMAMHLINSYLLIQLKSDQTYNELKFDKTIDEEITTDLNETQLPKIKKPNEIPDTI